MVQRAGETERKYEAAAGVTDPRPAYDGLPDVAGTRTLDPVELDAVYYDTPGLALAAHRVTLRRRTGGDDAGWHLKLPTSEADTRTEVRVPLGTEGTEGAERVAGPADTGQTGPSADAHAAAIFAGGEHRVPPAELRAEVAALTRGHPLNPVVRLRTHRRRELLLDHTGRTLAEIAHDTVHAQARDAAPTSWSETEVELHEGGPRLLDAVEERLAAAGLHRSTSPSKLARALGGGVLAAPPATPGRPPTAGRTATAYLREQLTAILALDPAARRAEEDAVHRMRVATRRARSALKSFRKELDRAATDPVGHELAWLAGVLGTARDREVLTERLGHRLGELDPALATRPLRRRLLERDGAPAGPHAAAPPELDSPRYHALLDALEALLAAPPYTPAADAPAAEAARATVRRDHARLRHGIEAALALPPGDARDTALHEARKDAKRARYSSEAAQAVLGPAATAHTARMKTVQQLLGEHQDSVMCRTALAALREDAERAGEDPAPYDALDRREREIAADVEAGLPAAWRDADRPL
ncbi:CYTH and CHAD domain-containing protein [Actinacidiphila acidipaludis]|uniref:CYTH and CHAD domain-containing protein n=1 Tax=Actinacidiphila acidipaludis TaxID=2873382 RepID=A0ABS7QC47_9ACTN|nr:CYTH and CHAD domain-containing protein [Streptomyces acidipaludis]MBY8880733.1 CYTH and CHAD domain-containing protein [Streptomyces acidipaludis]